MAHSHALKAHTGAASLFQRVAGAAEEAWTRYWTSKAERAAVFTLRSLDDRTLKDIGIDRSEIESVVYGDAARGERRIAAADRSVGCA